MGAIPIEPYEIQIDPINFIYDIRLKKQLYAEINNP